MQTAIDTIWVEDLDGNNVELLSLYNDQNLLLLLYNNQCLGCTGRAIPLAYKFQNMFQHIKVLGIHSNFRSEQVTKADITSIFTTKTLPFPIYIDDNHKVYDRFKSEGTPQWLLITKDKTLYRSIFGSQANAENRLLYALESLATEV